MTSSRSATPETGRAHGPASRNSSSGPTRRLRWARPWSRCRAWSRGATSASARPGSASRPGRCPSGGSTSSPRGRATRSRRCTRSKRWSRSCVTATRPGCCARAAPRPTSSSARGSRASSRWRASRHNSRFPSSRRWRSSLKRTAATRPEAELLRCCARTRLDDGTAERLATLLRSSLDWEWLLRNAHAHGLLPLLYRHLRSTPDSVPAEIRGALREGFEANAQRALRLTAELLRLHDQLASRGVTVIPYKGPVLAASVYGDLALRPFRDLDFLVQRHDADRAERVLAAEGYRPLYGLTPEQEKVFRAATCESAFSRNGDIVELHWAFGPRDFPLALEVEAVRTRLEPVAIGTTRMDTLCADDLLVVLCAHGAKHLWERLEWICDVAELLRSTPGLDLDGGLERARDLGVHRMVLLALRLARDLLDAPLPDTVARRAQADAAGARLAAQVQSAVFPHVPSPPPDRAGLSPFPLRAPERWRDLPRYCARGRFTPTLGDWAWLRLPDALYPLYYVVRPIRLVVKYGARLIRGARESLQSLPK